MTKKVIQKKLIECNEDLDGISKKLCEVREMEQNNDFEGYRDTSLEIARRAERFTCRIRELVSDTVFYNKNEFMLDMSKSQGITIEKEEEWVKIVMPFLLPKRRVTHSCSFIITPLKYAITNFINKTRIRRFDNCVICFRNVYTMNGKVIRDHDNIEAKQVLDEVAAYFVVDDTGLLCSNLYTTSIGDFEHTEVYIIPKANFEKWLKIYTI